MEAGGSSPEGRQVDPSEYDSCAEHERRRGSQSSLAKVDPSEYDSCAEHERRRGSQRRPSVSSVESSDHEDTGTVPLDQAEVQLWLPSPAESQPSDTSTNNNETGHEKTRATREGATRRISAGVHTGMKALRNATAAATAAAPKRL